MASALMGGTVYTVRYIDGGTIGGKNVWKVHDFTRVPPYGEGRADYV